MSRREHFLPLRDAAPAILPSLLMCDFADLRGEVARLEEAGAAAMHLDVMDGQFVPNLTYGMPIVEAVRRSTRLPVDVHLMIDRPARYLRQFYDAGADQLTIHVEAAPEPRAVLEEIRGLGAAAGLALNPATPLAAVEGCLDLCDTVLVMSVPAGFGGQPFDERALEKIRRVRELAPESLVEVDGGVNQATIARCREAGAQLFVVGSALFRSGDYRRAVRELAGLASGTGNSGTGASGTGNSGRGAS
jgi:ribulose-phosphate 3-epimerase